MSLLIANIQMVFSAIQIVSFFTNIRYKDRELKDTVQYFCIIFVESTSVKTKEKQRWNIKKEIIVTFSFLLRTEIASLSLPVFICPSDKLFNRASRALTLLILNRLHFPCSVDQRHSNPSFPDVTFATVIFYTWYMLLASMNFFFYEDKIFVMVVSSIQDY